MKRVETVPGRPVASLSASSVAARTAVWKASNRSQVTALSKVSLMTPSGTVSSRA